MNFKNHVNRLSQYKAVLQRMDRNEVDKTHAETIATQIGIPATQIRKDFSLFGIRGNKRGGYVVKDLLHELKTILGLNKQIPVILVGYGNLGKALSRYPGFFSRVVCRSLRHLIRLSVFWTASRLFPYFHRPVFPNI